MLDGQTFLHGVAGLVISVGVREDDNRVRAWRNTYDVSYPLGVNERAFFTRTSV